MKLGMFSNPNFVPTVEKLLKSKGLSVKAAWKLKNIAKKVEGEMQKFEEVKKGVFDQYGEKDEAGQLKPREDGRVYLDDAQKDLWVKALTDLQDISVEVGTVSISELDGTEGLTVEDLVILESIVVE